MSYLNELMSKDDYPRLFAREALKIEIVEKICEYMNKNKITKTDLAKRMGKHKSFITQVLSSERNFKVETLSDIAFALGVDLKITVNKVQQANSIQDQTNWKTLDEPIEREWKFPPRRLNPSGIDRGSVFSFRKAA